MRKPPPIRVANFRACRPTALLWADYGYHFKCSQTSFFFILVRFSFCVSVKNLEPVEDMKSQHNKNDSIRITGNCFRQLVYYT